MKRITFLILVVAIGCAPFAEAQTGKKVSKQQTVKKNGAAKKEMQDKTAATADTVTLTSESANQAYGKAQVRRLSITDPTINLLNRQAAGNSPLVSPSGIVGMPKRAYGFANGKILLRNTTAPSSGTMYGSGAVGTGTTIMGVGAGENAIGVNGKSPDAGPWLWGSKLPNRNLPLVDTARRR